MFTKDEKKDLERMLFSSEENRLKVALSLIPKIQEKIEQEKLFDFININKVEPGQIISKVKKEDAIALAIGESGESIERICQGDRIFPAEFLKSSVPTVPVVSVLKREYDLLENIIRKVSNNLIYKFTDLWYKLFSIAAITSQQKFKFFISNLIDESSSINLIIDFIKKGMNPITEKGEKSCLIISKEMFDVIKRISILKDELPENIFKVPIYVLNDIGEGFEQKKSPIPDNVLICTLDTPIIEMDRRIDLTAIGADKFKEEKPSFGFLFVQMQSLCLSDCSNVSIIELPI